MRHRAGHTAQPKLQQDYLQSQARIVFLKQETALRKLQQATSELRTEQAAAGSLAAQLRLIGLKPESLSTTSIKPNVPPTAPISGYIKAVRINPSQFVNPQDILIELVDRSDLHLELKVFECDIAKIKIGQDIKTYCSACPPRVPTPSPCPPPFSSSSKHSMMTAAPCLSTPTCTTPAPTRLPPLPC